MVVTILLVIAAYLLGSIPNAVWIGKRFYGVDVREHGSKNAGATNTLRVLGRRAAIPVLLLDFAKGFAAVMLFHLSPYKGTDFEFYLKLILVVAVVLGHVFPVFAGFKGGKGVATVTAAVMGVYPEAVLLCFLVFLIVLAVSHYVSLGSMAGGVMFPVLVIIFPPDRDFIPMLVFACIVAAGLVITHKRNIKRLIEGTESRIYLWKPKERGE